MWFVKNLRDTCDVMHARWCIWCEQTCDALWRVTWAQGRACKTRSPLQYSAMCALQYIHCTLYSVHCMNTVLFLALLFLLTPGEKHLTSPTFSVIHFLNIRTPPLHCAACACSACGIHCAACGVWGVTRVWLLETQPCLSPLLMALPVEEILILLAFSSTFVLVSPEWHFGTVDLDYEKSLIIFCHDVIVQ